MKIESIAILTVAAAFAALPAQAQVLNGGFSSGLTSWTQLGDVSIQSGAALLTTAAVNFEDDAPASAGAFNFSGIAAADSSNSLDTFSNLSVDALDPDAGSLVFAFEGSALKQTFTVGAGDVIFFQWQFLTNDPLADYAYVVINGTKINLGQASLASTSSSPFAFESAVNTFSSQAFPSAQTVDFVVGVVDVNDFNGTTALQFDNVQIVPEPSSAMLALAGLLGLAGRRRSRERK